jgi:hypothetical protein
MEGHKQKLIEAGESAKESSKAQADALDKMTLEEFIEKLDKGDGDIFQEATVQDAQKVPWKALAETPEGLKAIEAYKAQLAETLRNTVPKEIDGMVKEQIDAIDAMLEKAKKATIPDEFEQTIKDYEKFWSKIEEELKKATEEKNNPYDHLDEHALVKMADAERAKVFEEEAKQGIYRGVKVRSKDKSIDFELDRVNTKKGLIIEDKIAKGFEKNSNRIKAIQEWANKQIYNKTKKKIEFIKNTAEHVYYDPKSKGSSPFMPPIEQVKNIKSVEFRLQLKRGSLSSELMEALQTEIDIAIEALKAEFPDWKFDVVFGE